MPLAPKTISDLQQIVCPENVLTAPEDLIPYSFDGTAALKQMPGCIVFARNTEHVTLTSFYRLSADDATICTISLRMLHSFDSKDFSRFVAVLGP